MIGSQGKDTRVSLLWTRSSLQNEYDASLSTSYIPIGILLSNAFDSHTPADFFKNFKLRI